MPLLKGRKLDEYPDVHSDYYGGVNKITVLIKSLRSKNIIISLSEIRTG